MQKDPLGILKLNPRQKGRLDLPAAKRIPKQIAAEPLQLQPKAPKPQPKAPKPQPQPHPKPQGAPRIDYHPYNYSDYPHTFKLAPPMKIFMLASHITLVNNEKIAFERLGHKVYTLYDLYEDLSAGVDNKEFELTRDDIRKIDSLLMQTLQRFRVVNLIRPRIDVIPICKSAVFDLITKKFGVIYISQVGRWLAAMEPIKTTPIIFRTFGHSMWAVHGTRNNHTVREFDKSPVFFVVPVSHTEENTIPGKKTYILASLEQAITEGKKYNAKKDNFLTVHLGFSQEPIGSWKIVNARKKRLPQQELNELFAKCLIYIYDGTSPYIVKYAPLEAIAFGAMVVANRRGTLASMFKKGSVYKDSCHYSGDVLNGFRLAKSLSNDRAKIRQIANLQKNWLDNETRRCRYEWNRIFTRIAHKN